METVNTQHKAISTGGLMRYTVEDFTAPDRLLAADLLRALSDRLSRVIEASPAIEPAKRRRAALKADEITADLEQEVEILNELAEALTTPR